MKLVAFILTFISVSYALEDQCQDANLIAIYGKCMLENGNNTEVITDFLQLKEAKDENGKCFRACIMRECNYFGDDGKLNDNVPNRLATSLDGGTEFKSIEGAVTECVNSQKYSGSKCDQAEVFVRCVMEKEPVKSKISKNLNDLIELSKIKLNEK